MPRLVFHFSKEGRLLNKALGRVKSETYLWWRIAIAGNDDQTCRVQSTTACTSRHLGVFAYVSTNDTPLRIRSENKTHIQE